MRLHGQAFAAGWWQSCLDAAQKMDAEGKKAVRRDIVWPETPVVDMEGSCGSALLMYGRQMELLGMSKTVSEALKHWRALVDGDLEEWARLEEKHPGARELYLYGFISLGVVELPYRRSVRVVAATRTEFPLPSAAQMRRWLGVE